MVLRDRSMADFRQVVQCTAGKIKVTPDRADSLEVVAAGDLLESSLSMATGRSTPELMPICSTVDVQVPPFASIQFPVEREGSSQFSIKTRGDGIVLQMLRPLETGVKIYKVDSTIQFGGEAETHK